MSKEEILDYFRHINAVYNDCSMHDSLSNMLDEFEQEIYGKGYNQGTIDRAEEITMARKQGYTKAIDEFAKKLSQTIKENYFFAGEFKRWTLQTVDDIAEELKEGVEE